jgi:hypothetical protein
VKLSEIKINFKLNRLIYPFILLLIFGTVSIVLIRTISFSRNIINGIFLSDSVNPGQLLHVDLNSYQIVSKKLGIQPDVVQPDVPVIDSTANVLNFVTSTTSTMEINTNTVNFVTSTEIVSTNVSSSKPRTR